MQSWLDLSNQSFMFIFPNGRWPDLCITFTLMSNKGQECCSREPDAPTGPESSLGNLGGRDPLSSLVLSPTLALASLGTACPLLRLSIPFAVDPCCLHLPWDTPWASPTKPEQGCLGTQTLDCHPTSMALDLPGHQLPQTQPIDIIYSRNVPRAGSPALVHFLLTCW